MTPAHSPGASSRCGCGALDVIQWAVAADRVSEVWR